MKQFRNICWNFFLYVSAAFSSRLTSTTTEDSKLKILTGDTLELLYLLLDETFAWITIKSNRMRGWNFLIINSKFFKINKILWAILPTRKRKREGEKSCEFYENACKLQLVVNFWKWLQDSLKLEEECFLLHFLSAGKFKSGDIAMLHAPTRRQELQLKVFIWFSHFLGLLLINYLI